MTQSEFQKKPLVAQLLYSGLGGHGGVVFSMMDAGAQHRWRNALGFLGIESLLPAYAKRCADDELDCQYMRATARRPWRSYRPVYLWLKRVRPEIILLHSLSSLPPAWLYARRHGIPIVVVEHQNNELKTRQERLFSRLAMWAADAIVLLTPRYRDELAATLGRTFRPEKVRIIANGINVAAFRGSRPSTQRPGKVVRIGMAARFSRTKRFDLALDMLRILRSRNPTIEWQLSLAGSGERWDEIRQIAGRDNFGDSLVFEGMLSGSALPDWYRSLDVYCHPSDGETLSVSVLQAMATGLPIAGSDVEGISNLLAGNPPVGKLVSRQTGEAFAAAVEIIASHPKESRAMGDRARSVADRSYSDKAMFESYSKLVADLLDDAHFGRSINAHRLILTDNPRFTSNSFDQSHLNQ